MQPIKWNNSFTRSDASCICFVGEHAKSGGLS